MVNNQPKSSLRTLLILLVLGWIFMIILGISIVVPFSGPLSDAVGVAIVGLIVLFPTLGFFLVRDRRSRRRWRQRGSNEATAGFPRAPEMPEWLWKKLEAIPHPTASLGQLSIDSITYRPAAVVLKDGSHHDCVIFFGQFVYGRLHPSASPNRLIRIEDISEVMASRYQLPPQFADKLYAHGETRMGGIDFKLTMRDGKDFYYVLGSGVVDFINYPDGYSGSDISDIQIFSLAGFRRMTSADVLGHLGGPGVEWGLYSETRDELEAIRKAQPGLFTNPIVIRFGPPKGFDPRPIKE